MSLKKYKIIWYDKNNIEIGSRMLDSSEYSEISPYLMHMELKIDERTPPVAVFWDIVGVDGADDPIPIERKDFYDL